MLFASGYDSSHGSPAFRSAGSTFPDASCSSNEGVIHGFNAFDLDQLALAEEGRADVHGECPGLVARGMKPRDFDVRGRCAHL